jgi:hypothetical protein
MLLCSTMMPNQAKRGVSNSHPFRTQHEAEENMRVTVLA